VDSRHKLSIAVSENLPQNVAFPQKKKSTKHSENRAVPSPSYYPFRSCLNSPKMNRRIFMWVHLVMHWFKT